ncbi:tyrosine-type recombinase/integrase [Romboutsia sp.]|uniref:tyrosine-type recombinase/integrase n=1 Tax=Romboutsia sp. TaxID=1965302 RepID=UPI002C8551CD|nr:tyrosine-type recombinase/integrase [Romboutsia sp.]HSQ90011.1 tyrosine-type recombinase/integrase [Romboutsia sp.]
MKKVKRAAKPIKNTRDVKRMIAYLEASSDNYGKRNSILFQIGVTTGYRAGDLVGLTVSEIKEVIKTNEFIILESKKVNSKNIRKKNIKPRRVPLSPKLKVKLKSYISTKEDWEYMFPSNKGDGYIEVDTISKILKRAGEYLGLYYTTAHCMRKTYAYKIYVDSGYDIIAVKEMLGHSSIEETKLYLDLERLKYDNYSKSLDDFL